MNNDIAPYQPQDSDSSVQYYRSYDSDLPVPYYRPYTPSEISESIFQSAQSLGWAGGYIKVERSITSKDGIRFTELYEVKKNGFLPSLGTASLFSILPKLFGK